MTRLEVMQRIGTTPMFTGIVEKLGIVARTQSTPGGKRLRVSVGTIASECALGASVSISGVCLTVAGAGSDWLEFDVITETLACSTLGEKKTGSVVNIERALRVGDRIDGHFVQGHIDAIARVQRIDKSSREYVVWLSSDASLRPYIVPKGSISLDGVSLTIAAIEGELFSVALIPTTLECTTLGSLKAGDFVNVESDVVTRTVVHHLRHARSADTSLEQSLEDAGFR